MTGLAFRFSLVTMIDWEGMLGQLGRVPAAGFVAVFTDQAKIPKVNLWFRVTIFTLRRCTLVKLIDMASLAFNLDMAPIQAEDILVIEGTHTIETVMALEAAAAQFSLMLKHKGLIIERVAAKAGLFRIFVLHFLVAALTINSTAIEINLVPIKGESCVGIMVKRHAIYPCRAPGCGIMASRTI
jgi:hypothetical protein